MSDRECTVPGCGHVHALQCLLMSIASGGMQCVHRLRQTAPYGQPGVEILDEVFHQRVGLWEELQTTLARLTKSAGSPVGGKASETPVPYHDRASAVAHRMRNELSTWARMLAEEHPHLTLPVDSPPAVARWLASHPSLFTFDMVSGVTAVVRDAERVIDRAPDRVYAGPCLEPLTDEAEALLAEDPAAEIERCDGQLYATKGRGFVGCRECGARHAVTTRQDWLSTQLGPSLVTAGEASPYLSWLTGKDIKVDTIHKWRRHRAKCEADEADEDEAMCTCTGRIEVRGHREGRPLYLFSDLKARADDVKTRESKPRDKEGSVT